MNRAQDSVAPLSVIKSFPTVFQSPYMGAYLGKGTYWQLIISCWLYFGVMFQI